MLVHSSVDEYLGRFYFSAIVNNAATDIDVETWTFKLKYNINIKLPEFVIWIVVVWESTPSKTTLTETLGGKGAWDVYPILKCFRKKKRDKGNVARC